MSFGTTTPEEEHDMEWAQMVNEQQRENELLHAENALKLTQILDLEQLLYELRGWEDDIQGPCWLESQNGAERCVWDDFSQDIKHSPVCTKARQATEPFWKK